MSTAAFKSTSRRGTGNSDPPTQTQRKRRSLSVSAVSRRTTTTPSDISLEFLNKRENPLFWTTTGDGGGFSPEKETQEGNPSSESKGSTASQRGRLVTRNSDVATGEKKIGRSLSRVDNGRRGRSMSRGNFAFGASESEVEQESINSWKYGSRSSSNQPSNIVKKPASSLRRAPSVAPDTLCKSRSSQSHLEIHPSIDYTSNVHIRNWEDGISTGSLSEAEEKTIKAVCEQMKSFRGDNMGGEATTSGIYETVRSEVRRAISDIQIDLESALCRNSTSAIATADVTDIPPYLVKPGAVELVLDIRREYAKKLEESQERARKLRSDLAVEEHRGQELSRILKETLPDPKTSTAHRSRLGRRKSSERKTMSKRLTDEAMSYFDECVSISTFDSSDFSAAEDFGINSVATTVTVGGATSFPQESPYVSASCGPSTCLENKQFVHNHEDSGLTANSSCNEPIINQPIERGKYTEWGKESRFSFGHSPTESIMLQQDIRNYIRNFKKDEADTDTIISNKVKSNYYDSDGYDLLGSTETLLFDKVFLKNRIETGSLHICGGGISISLLPFASYI